VAYVRPIMRLTSYVVPFLFVLCPACASTAVPAPQAVPPTSGTVAADTTTVAEPPPPMAGDIQFTLADPKAKAAPADDSATLTTIQPQRSTPDGIKTQHVHAAY
jgi:hypothetical protein